jgi:hypothetical protein
MDQLNDHDGDRRRSHPRRIRDDPVLLKKAVTYLTDRPWEVQGAGIADS